MKNMKKKSNIIAGSVLLLALMTGCGSGNGNGNHTQNSTPPQGPINYQNIEAKFKNNNSNKFNNQTSLLSSSSPGGACGGVMSNSAAGVNIAAGFFNLIPDAGPVLGAIIGSGGQIINGFGAAAGSSCIASEFANVQYQLFTQQQEINNIQTNLSLDYNVIWSAVNKLAQNQQSSDYTNFSNDITYITGNDGIFMKANNAAGFYDINEQRQTTMTMQQLLGSSGNLSVLSSYLNGLTGNNALTIENITGTGLSPSTCDVEIGNLNNSICYKNVTQKTDTDLMNLLTATFTTLQSNLVESLNSNQNPMPLLDDYNNTIMVYYQQSLSAIQEAYHLAYLANYLNYYQAESQAESIYQGKSTIVSMPDIFGVPGTYYGGPGYYAGTPAQSFAESASTNTAYYNTAQLNLTLFAAAMVNQLYSNVMGYIVTDTPVGLQTYPNNQIIPYVNESGNIMAESSVEFYESSPISMTINYTKLIGASLSPESSTASKVLATALSQAKVITQNQALVASLSALGGNSPTGTSPNIFFYQYNGINNVASCIGALESYNLQNGSNGSLAAAINNASCPSLLLDTNNNPVNQSVFESTTIQPYSVNSNGLPELSGYVTNNVNSQACSPIAVGNIPAYNLYWYTPSSSYQSLGVPGTKYLMCGNWNVNASNLYNPGLNGGQVLSSTWIYATMLWSTTDANNSTVINFPQQMTTNVMTIDSNAVWSQSLTGYQSLNPSTNEASLGNVGQSFPAILSGWVNKYWPSYNSNFYQGTYHVAAVQTTLPDGFIAPYGVTINNWEGMYLTYSGPAINNGGITFGLSYNPNVLKSGVTINGKPLYESSDTNTAVLPWNSGNTAQLTLDQLGQLNYWIPVTSSSINSNISTIVVNGNRLVTVGGVQVDNTSNNNGGNVSVCVVNPTTSNPSIYTNITDTSLNNNSPHRMTAIVGYFDSCLAGMGSVLNTGASLWAIGKSTIVSPNGQYKLIMQTDGNLVMYKNNGTPIWSSGTMGSGTDNQLIMQSAGNLVMYSNGTAVWATPASTIGSGSNNYLSVQDDGNLVIYSGPNNTNPVWSSGSAQ